MKVSQASSFIAYELDPIEQLAGYTFNAANRAVIQNLISSAAEDFLLAGLQADGTELVMSLDEKLRLAELRGSVNILRHLLLTADVLKEELEAKQTKDLNPSQDSL
jgi:hypothetical protein